jgi:hypothetical protein
MASLELLERLREGWRPPVEVLEHEPRRELVASKDILRQDGIGRTVVACPAGQPPAHWLQLTQAERNSLVEPPEPKPQGHLNPGPYGFSPEGVSMSRVHDRAPRMTGGAIEATGRNRPHDPRYRLSPPGIFDFGCPPRSDVGGSVGYPDSRRC